MLINHTSSILRLITWTHPQTGSAGTSLFVRTPPTPTIPTKCLNLQTVLHTCEDQSQCPYSEFKATVCPRTHTLLSQRGRFCPTWLPWQQHHVINRNVEAAQLNTHLFCLIDSLESQMDTVLKEPLANWPELLGSVGGCVCLTETILRSHDSLRPIDEVAEECGETEQTEGWDEGAGHSLMQ